MSTFTRRLALDRQLAAATEPCTIAALARRFGVSKNTLQRDLDALSTAGVPIREEAQGQTIRYWSEGARTTQSVATPAERASLDAAAARLGAFRGTPLPQSFASARSRLGTSTHDAGFAVAEPEGIARVPAGVYETVLQARLELRKCRLHYRAREAAAERSHLFEPERLVFHLGLVYVLGRVAARRTPVTFALHRVRAAELLRESYRLPRAPSPVPFGAWSGKLVRVRVRFDASIADYVRERRWHPTQKLIAEPDGAVLFEARVGGLEEFVGWVMGWGDRVELLEPPAFRAELLRRAKGMLVRHGA